jgi:hypothetical protein
MNYFELLKKFGEHSGQLMAEVKDLPSMQGEGNKRHLLTSIHRLNIDLNTKFVELNRIKSDINKVVVFLKRFPTRKFYEENEITELDYIKYHLEVFFHKVATGSDLLKLLVNVLFELNIANKQCNTKKLKEKIPNKYINPFIGLIEAYDESFKNIKFFRHKNSHEAKFYDDKFDRLEMYDRLYRNSKKFDLSIKEFQIIMPEGYLDFSIKELRKDKIEWVKNAIDVYETYIDKIIESSIYVYFEKYKLWLENCD